jgi:hypothetical protein
MNTKNPTANNGQYPERDKVEDIDQERPKNGRAVPNKTERKREERGNRGPDEQPGYGQGA